MGLNIEEIQKQVSEEFKDIKEEEKKEEDLTPEEVVEEAIEEQEEETKEEEEESPEEESEDEPELEDVEEDDADLESDVPPKSYKAWGKMRKALKESQTEKQELSERLARLEGRFEERREEPVVQEAVAAEPDRDLDPDAWRDWRIDSLEKKLDSNSVTQEGLQRTQVMDQAKQELRAIEESYKDIDPDYDQKMKFLVDVKTKELRLTNPTISDVQIKQQIDIEKINAAGNFVNSNQNPAEVFAKLAMGYGYEPKSNKDKKTEIKKSIDTVKLKHNMERNSSLIGGTSAGETEDSFSPRQIMELSLQQLSEMNPKQRKQVEKAIAKTAQKV